MSNLQKWGGFSALYMAFAYIIGIILFIFVLDYPHIIETSQKLSLLTRMHHVVFLTNLLMYVLFGIALIVFTLSIYNLFKSISPSIIQVVQILGIVWAGLLIASGMISNAAIDPAITLFKKTPLTAETYWQSVETITNGLSFVNGEILGGLFTLLISIACFKVKHFSKLLIIIGFIVGIIGIISTVPGLKDLTSLFGIGQIIWFIWFGLILLRNKIDVNVGV